MDGLHETYNVLAAGNLQLSTVTVRHCPVWAEGLESGRLDLAFEMALIGA